MSLSWYLTIFHSYDNKENDFQETSKVLHQNQYTGTGQPVVLVPLNAERQARKLQLNHLKSDVWPPAASDHMANNTGQLTRRLGQGR